MCGIVGIARLGATDIIEKDRDVFAQMLSAGVVRGHHGTGVFSVDASGGAKLVKMAGPPYMLFVSEAFHKFWAEILPEKTRILVGHNRFATTGEKTTKHAHPFMKDKIVMVHNGSLAASTSTPDFKNFAVDSEAMTHSIATIGLEATLAKTDGAYAIVYWDLKTQTLNMVRNHERPLHVFRDKMMGRVLFASEKEMLEWIVKRNYYDGTGTTFDELPVNTLWSFKIGDADPTETRMPLKPATTYPTSYKGYTADAYASNSVWDPIGGKFVQRGQSSLFVPEDEQQQAIDEFFNGLRARATVPSRPYTALPPPKATPAATTLPPKRDERTKEVFPNSKEYIQSPCIFSKDRSAKLLRGDKISVWVDDHVPEDAAKEHHVIIATHEAWPNCRFQFRVSGDGTLDAIFEAIVVEITLKNFLEPNKDCKSEETIIWASDPRIVMGNTTTVLH